MNVVTPPWHDGGRAPTLTQLQAQMLALVWLQQAAQVSPLQVDPSTPNDTTITLSTLINEINCALSQLVVLSSLFTL